MILRRQLGVTGVNVDLRCTRWAERRSAQLGRSARSAGPRTLALIAVGISLFLSACERKPAPPAGAAHKTPRPARRHGRRRGDSGRG